MKTICIAGKNDIAVNILLYCLKHYKKNNILVITNKNETGKNSWQKSLKWFAEKNNVKEIELKEAYEIENMIFLSLEFDRIITPSKFKTTELYNIHFSMLPKYKGCFTSILPILNGEEFTGVTLHRIRPGIDTGEIIEQRKVQIEENDNSLDLYQKLIKNGTDVVLNKLGELLNGHCESIPQEKKGSTYFGLDYIDYSKIELNIKCTAFQIRNQVRAFNFRPYQLIKWNDVRYMDAIILDHPSEKKAGTVLEDNIAFTKISTIDYDVVLCKDVFDIFLGAIQQHNNDYAKSLCISSKLLEAKDSHGWTALTVAVYNDNFEMVKYLVENGADYNVINNNGTNLLMYAKDCYVNTGNDAIFNYLMGLGVSPESRDYYDKNLYEYCEQEGINEIGKNLLKKKGDI